MQNFDVAELFWKFVRFGIVGLTSFIIDFGITYVSKEVFRTHKYVANAFGFGISATFNYFLNRAWTFHSTNPHMGMEFLRFIAVATAGLGINTGVLYFAHHNKKWNFYAAKLGATVVVMFWNFFINLFFTFHK